MTNGTYQYYAGSMVYKANKSLNYLLMDEGMVNKVSGGYAYEYPCSYGYDIKVGSGWGRFAIVTL